MTSQQRAELLLDLWQSQAAARVPAAQRQLPQNDNQSAAEFERDLEIIRKCIERKS